MANLIAPKTLGDVWQLPVGAFNQGMRGYDQAQEMDNMTLAQMTSKEQYDQQQRPMLLEQLAGQNRNRNAELPGITARSRIATNQADKSDNTFDSDLAAHYAANRDKINASHINQLMRTGPALLQYAESAAYNPQSISQFRQQLVDMGAWNPEWDNASPADVSAGLYDLGTAMANATPQMQKLLEQLQSKENIAADKNRTQLELQDRRAALGRELARLRSGGKGGSSKDRIKRLEELLAQAYQNGDMDTAAQIADTMRFVRGRDEVKPQVDPAQVPILKPPTPAVNPLKTQEQKPDPLGIR